MNKILDISKHQGNINFSKMKEQGINGVMCRCAYSSSQDTMFETYIKDAQTCGIAVGAYAFCTWHYSSVSVNKATAMLAAQSQSNKVISILKEKNITGPVAIDLELESGAKTVLSKEDMTCVANMYLEKLKDAGYTPMLYCSISWLFDKMVCKDIKYPLWVAYYHSDGLLGNEFPKTKYGDLMNSIKDKIWMWQYSSNGDGKKFGASSQRIDLNHCYINFSVGTNNYAPPKNNGLNANSIYTVVKGDTLSSIAREHSTTLLNLISANPQIINPNLIYSGQKINIPSHCSKPVSKPDNISVGSTVRVRPGAKTFDGKSIASFVFSNTYTVDQIKGDRAVLDLTGICTPVNTADLIRVG